MLYSEATDALRRFAEATGVAVCETQAGKSAMPWDHPLALGAIGATGSQAANQFAREADLVIAVGTRLGDFTTMSKTAFANADVRFVAINVCELDAFKHAAIPVVADARMALEELGSRVSGYSTGPDYRATVAARAQAWTVEVERLVAPGGGVPFAQAEVVGAVNQSAHPEDVVVCVPVDPALGVPGYDSWWDVAVAEVSEQPSVREARRLWQDGQDRARYFLRSSASEPV